MLYTRKDDLVSQREQPTSEVKVGDMTCVVAVVTGHKKVLMGADSLIRGGDDAWSSEPKIWKAGAGRYGIGYAGDFAWGEMLRYRVRWPTLTTDLPKRLKDCIQSAAVRAKLDLNSKRFSGGALVCHAGVIYAIDNALNVLADPTRDYAAIGTEDIANGVLYATKNWNPKRRVLAALEAAAEHSTTVRSPWVLLQV